MTKDAAIAKLNARIAQTSEELVFLQALLQWMGGSPGGKSPAGVSKPTPAVSANSSGKPTKSR